jgi:DNA-binding XRE family transcriptional regulator
MRKPRTDYATVTLASDKYQQFVGPRKKLRLLVTLLDEFKFKPVTASEEASISWDKMVRQRIEQFSQPGLALRGARLKNGLTQVELARKLGIPQYNVSKMENGRRPIGKKMALRLAEILDVDYRIFL